MIKQPRSWSTILGMAHGTKILTGFNSYKDLKFGMTTKGLNKNPPLTITLVVITKIKLLFLICQAKINNGVSRTRTNNWVIRTRTNNGVIRTRTSTGIKIISSLPKTNCIKTSSCRYNYTNWTQNRFKD